MPVFEYKGFDAAGKPVKGLRDADSVKALRASLKKEGVLATDVNQSGKGGGKASGKKGGKQGDKCKGKGIWTAAATGEGV